MSEQNTTPVPEEKPDISAGRSAVLVLVILALSMVICATLFAPWPDDQIGTSYAPLVSHWQRAFNGDMVIIAPETPVANPLPAWLTHGLWLARRMVDILHYLLILLGGGCIGWLFLQDRRLPWVGLMIVGGIGTLYSGSMALYNAPLIATPGYLLILWAAIFTLLSWK